MPWLSPSTAQAAARVGAVVGAIEGEAEVSGDTGQEIQKLASGSAVNPGDAVFTEEKGKLLLRWDSGLMGSLGEFSSILVLPEDVGGPATDIQMTDGIFRLSVDPRSRQPAHALFGYHCGSLHTAGILRSTCRFHSGIVRSFLHRDHCGGRPGQSNESDGHPFKGANCFILSKRLH